MSSEDDGRCGHGTVAFQVLAQREEAKKKKKEGGQKGGDGRAQLFDFESGLCIIQRELKLFPVRAWISGGRFCIGPSACGGK